MHGKYILNNNSILHGLGNKGKKYLNYNEK